jgi:hypothetical protein
MNSECNVALNVWFDAMQTSGSKQFKYLESHSVIFLIVYSAHIWYWTVYIFGIKPCINTVDILNCGWPRSNPFHFCSIPLRRLYHCCNFNVQTTHLCPLLTWFTILSLNLLSSSSLVLALSVVHYCRDLTLYRCIPYRLVGRLPGTQDGVCICMRMCLCVCACACIQRLCVGVCVGVGVLVWEGGEMLWRHADKLHIMCLKVISRFGI